MNRFFCLSLITLLSAGLSRAQYLRPESMGHLGISIKDKDTELNLFDYSNNPAWLYLDQQDASLSFSPSYSNNWGDYRRKLSAEGTSAIQAGFTGIKPLGKNGTFMGGTTYTYEKRRNNFRTLLKDTYNGDPFYFTDTTSADFIYKGPVFEFMHSLPVTDNLYLGAIVNYGISNGNKKLYSYAESTHRIVNGKVGLAYTPLSNLVLGADISISDMQERLKLNDINVYTIISYHYRGDKYPVNQNETTIDHKIKQSGASTGFQVSYIPLTNMNLIAEGRYSTSELKTMVGRNDYTEYEEGLTSFEYYGGNIAGQYSVTDKLMIGMRLSYTNNNSWSRLTEVNSKIWELEEKDMNITLGASYHILPCLLAGVEYSYTNVKYDSTKYIDNNFTSGTSDDNYYKAGIEYNVLDCFYVRAGYNYGMAKYDLVYGGKDTETNLYDFGVEYVVADKLSVSGCFEYRNTKAKVYLTSPRKNEMRFLLNLKLFTF